MRSRYRERPDYRVDLLARTNVMTAWLGETCLARSGACLTVDEQDHGLVVYFTGHLSISAAMRAHPGIGTAQAHHTVSTAVMGIGVSFHDPVTWDGWIRYHHESTFAGAGMAYAAARCSPRTGGCSPRSPRTP